MKKNKINFSLIAFFLLSFFIFFSCILTLPSEASAFPKKELVYKGRLTNSAGNIVDNGNYDITFSIYSQASGGNSLWSESQSVLVTKGIFSATLGVSNPVNVDFNDGTYYIGIKIGSDSEMSPRQQIGAAPFALNSQKLDGSEAGTDANKILKLGASGEINIAGKITTSNDLQAGSSTLSALTVQNDSDLKGKLALASDATFGGSLTVSSNVTAPNLVYSVKGTSGKIYSSGGQNPTIDIDSNYSGQTSITTLGTIVSGTWNGTAISDSYVAALGGANQGDIIYRNASGWTKLAAGTSGQYLKTNGAGANPSWNGISGSVPSGTVNNSTLRWDNGGSAWVENTNLLVGSTGVITSGTWNGSPIDISSYTNLSVSNPITLTGDSIGLSYNTTNLQLSTGVLNTIQNIATSSSPTFAGLGLTGSLNFSGVASDITTTSGEDLTLSPGGAGRIINAGNALMQGTLGIRDASTSYYTTFQGGTQTANLTYTLPTSYPAVSGYVLSSTTGGTMSWIAQSAATNYWTASGNDIYKNNSGNVGIGTTAPSTLLQLGNAGSTAGVLSLAGGTSGLVTMQPASAAGTWTLTLPTAAGTNGYVLSTDGSGTTSWIAQSAGTSYWTASGNDIYKNNTGNVGIGATAPSTLLQLGTSGSTKGVVSFAGDTSGLITMQPASAAGTWTLTLPTAAGTNGYVLSTDGSGTTSWIAQSAGTSYWTASGNDIYKNNTGNVGIGTTSPGTLLQLGTSGVTAGVLSLAGGTSGLITIDTAVAAGTWTLTLPTTAGTNGYVLSTNGGGTTSWIAQTVDTNYWTASGNDIYKNNSGNVGIGTTAPSTLLQLGTAGSTAGVLSLAGGTSGLITINTAAAAGTWTLTLPTSAGTNGYVLSTNGSGTTSWVTQPTFTNYWNENGTDIYKVNSGNVGIGTTAPSTLLQLGDPGVLGGIFSIAGATSGLVTIDTALIAGTWTLTLPTSAGTNGYVLSTDGSGNTSWVAQTVDTNYWGRNSGSGYVYPATLTDKVGIGINSPAKALEILDASAAQIRLTYTATSVYTDLQTTSDGYFYINPSGGRIGIGTNVPASTFSIGASSEFQVNSTGNLIKINNIAYSWPASQGSTNTYLKNDGSGNLTWGDNPVTNQKLGTVSNLRAWQSTDASVVVKADSAVMWNSATSRSWEAWDVNRTIDITASGLDGLDTGAEAINTWYYIWLIGDGTNARGLFSTSSTAPTMPDGYTFKKLVGAARNDNSSNLIKFMQNGNKYSYYTGFTNGILSLGTATTWTTVDVATYVPLAISNIVTVGAEAATNGPGDGTGYANISGDGANTVTRVYAKRLASSWSDTQTVDIPITDGSSTIYYQNDVSPANINLTMWVTGFYVNY
jgi:hypothetical protein